MQAEFVNVFIEKQRDHLMDFVSRLIMTETKLELAEKVAESTQKQLDDLTSNHEDLQKRYDELEEEKTQETLRAKATQDLCLEKDAELSRLNVEMDDCKAELHRIGLEVNEQMNSKITAESSLREAEANIEVLKSQINTLNTELESAKNVERNMVSDYTELTRDYEALKVKYQTLKDQSTVKPKQDISINKRTTK